MNTGMAFHCHHTTLVEYCYGREERIKYIKEFKAATEQELRLKLFKFIPLDRLPNDLRNMIFITELLIKKQNKNVENHEKWNAILRVNKNIIMTIFAQYMCWLSQKQLSSNYRKNERILYKIASFIRINNDLFEMLHKELCPDCPWDGTTIFPINK